MRMFPSTVHAFRSSAERRVFDLLNAMDLGSHQFAIHSLNLSQHEYKKWAELDFIVVWEDGIYVLEVKGGRVSCHNGLWTFTNRYGEQNTKSEGPFDQASSGMYALRTALDQMQPGLGKKFCWGWGVVFPDIVFDAASPSWSPAQVADRTTFEGKHGFARYLDGLSAFWRAKGGQYVQSDESAIDKLQHALRPDFDKVPPLSGRVDRAMEEIVRLTDEQLVLLDSVDENTRILCTGGAGTGKSFIAAEVARREAASGRRTALVCRSPIFAAYLANRLEHSPVVVADAGTAAKMASEGITFESLVVDEAQDLLAASHLAWIGRLLEGGLEQGRWRFFLDPNNQTGLHEPADPEALVRLRRLSANQRLRRNCRNTEQIVLQTQIMTGADIGRAIVEGGGPPIEFVYVQDAADSATRLRRRLEQWLEEGIRPGQISILSARTPEQSVVRLLPPALLNRLVRLEPTVANRWPIPEMSVATIREFKGLENRFIALVDLDDFVGSSHWLAQLYVGMTRAHAGLWIAAPANRRGVFDSLMNTHTMQMLARKGAT